MRPLARGSTSTWIARLRQGQREVARLMPAQPGADHQHGIAGLVEFLHAGRAVAMQPAEGHRMVLGDDRPARSRMTPRRSRAAAAPSPRPPPPWRHCRARASAASPGPGSPPPRPARPRRAAGQGGSAAPAYPAGRGAEWACAGCRWAPRPLTGPIGGVSARAAARVSTPSASCAERMRKAAFQTAASIAVWPGTSCTVPMSRSMYFVGVWPVMCSTGEPANCASTSPATVLAAPGPVEGTSPRDGRRRAHRHPPYARRPSRRAP